jgi:hypothetical protein
MEQEQKPSQSLQGTSSSEISADLKVATNLVKFVIIVSLLLSS